MEPGKLYFVMQLRINLDPSELTGLKYTDSLYSAVPGKDSISLYALLQANIKGLALVGKIISYPGHVIPHLY